MKDLKEVKQVLIRFEDESKTAKLIQEFVFSNYVFKTGENEYDFDKYFNIISSINKMFLNYDTKYARDSYALIELFYFINLKQEEKEELLSFLKDYLIFI